MYNNNNNLSDEESAIVSALSHVIKGVGSSSLVIIEPQPGPETCDVCGMRVPDECFGCDLYPAGGEEERKKKNKYTGAYLQPSGKWTAEIMAPGKQRKWLGTYKTEEEAARAYDRANIMYRGRTAKTNFPINEYMSEIQPEGNVEGSQNADGCDDVSKKKS